MQARMKHPAMVIPDPMNALLTLECKSQDTAGAMSRILRAPLYRDSVFSGRLPAQTTVPIFPQYPEIYK
jgi:hypothetical protein